MKNRYIVHNTKYRGWGIFDIVEDRYFCMAMKKEEAEKLCELLNDQYRCSCPAYSQNCDWWVEEDVCNFKKIIA